MAGILNFRSVNGMMVINAINTRVEEMAVKFLVGDESLDNFDAYVEEINGMGLQECLDIEQAALDRYMVKKVK